MAASMGSMQNMYRKAACYTRDLGRLSNVHRYMYIQSKSLFTSITRCADKREEQGGVAKGDTDFYGVEELREPSYETEVLDDIRSRDLQDIDAAYFTRKALKQYRLKSVTEEQPFGTIRYDKGSRKSRASARERREQEEADKKRAEERRVEKAKKRLLKKEDKLGLRRAENISCVSGESFENYEVMKDVIRRLQPSRSKSELPHDVKTNASSNTSYIDEIYFGDRTDSSDVTDNFKQASVFDRKEESAIKKRGNDIHLESAGHDMDQAASMKSSAKSSLYGHQMSLDNQVCIEHAKEQDTFDYIDEQYFGQKNEMQMSPIQSFDSMMQETEREMNVANEKDDSYVHESVPVETSKSKQSKSTRDDKTIYKKDHQKTEMCLEEPDFNTDAIKRNIVNKQPIVDEVNMERKQKNNDKLTNKPKVASDLKPIHTGNTFNQQKQTSKEMDQIQSFHNVRNQTEIGNRRATKRKSTSAKELDENETSAYRTAQQLRQEFEKRDKLDLYGKANPKEFDSKGFRILSGQIPNLNNVPRMEIIKVLRQNILFSGNDVVAIHKPFGLPLQGGVGKDQSIDCFLDDVIPSTTLHSIETMESDVTGVMLFSKTENMKNTLQEMFQKGEVCKKYLTITKNVPKLPLGEIDIPIVSANVNGKHRMALRPHRTPEIAAVIPKRQPGRDAVTRYRVLDSKDNDYALLECIPLTAVKHQIRAHLAFGLNCPILGDHKYAHTNKLAPMNLHPSMLERLKIQQSKVRHLSLHLHLRSIAIPNFLNGRNLFLSAPFPVHFLANMRDLKLKLPTNC